MFTNKLKLNPDKTAFMLIGNKCHHNKFNSEFPVEILNNSIPSAAHAKNLGVYIDSDFNFQYHKMIFEAQRIKRKLERC